MCASATGLPSRARSRWWSRPRSSTARWRVTCWPRSPATPTVGGAPAEHPRRDLGRARRRQVDVHRVARHPPDRQGHRVGVLAVDPSSVRTGGSVLGDKTRMARLAGRPRRLHPALAQRRHARRRRPGHRAGDGGPGGGGLRRGAGRDGRRRPVRGHRRGDGRHVPVPHPGPHRRPAAGHQEGHPRDRRRHRGQQGRRRPRGRGPLGRARAGRCAAARARQGGVGPSGRHLLRPHRLRRRGRLAARARPPRAPGRRASPASGPSSSWTSPGRWSATSSTSGCGVRRVSRGSARKSAPRCCPASWPPRPPQT